MPRPAFRPVWPFLSAAVVAFTGNTVTAQTYTNDTGGSVTFYGQFSPTLQYFDDGVKTYSNLADNASSNSRLGFNLDQELANGQNLRFNFEAAVGFPQTSDFSQTGDDPIWEWQITDLRKLEIIYSGDFGKLSLGQGSMATDGAAGASFAGTGMTSTASLPDFAGGYRFRDKDTDGLTDVAIGDAFDDLDGTRRFRLRFDTPEASGFTGSVAYGKNELTEGDNDIYYDVALNYGDSLGDFEVEGTLGYTWRDRENAGTDRGWVGSVAALHSPTGLNGSLSFGSQKDGANYAYGKIGWVGDFWAVGSSNFSADYFDGQDFDRDGSDSTSWGLDYTQNFDAISLEGYVGYRTYAFKDKTGVDYHDATSLLAGVRWSF